jgi:guanine deaminase
MTPNDFMDRAIAIAKASLNEPGTLPYGAVVVRDGEILGEGLNRAISLSDPTSHGEIEAIRDACRKLGTTDLSGAAMYTTGEPCSMCAATMLLCGIERLYYAADGDDSAALISALASKNPKIKRRLSLTELREQVGTPTDQRKMPSDRLGVDETRALFKEFADRNA